MNMFRKSLAFTSKLLSCFTIERLNVMKPIEFNHINNNNINAKSIIYNMITTFQRKKKKLKKHQFEVKQKKLKRIKNLKKQNRINLPFKNQFLIKQT